MTETAAAPLPTDSRRWIALLVLCVGVLMIILDTTIVNVALPSIQSDLGFAQADLAWVVNAYLIAFGGLLLLAGRVGDLFGRKGVFLAGLAVFTAASLACSVAQSQGVLIAARFVQGIGGAMTSAVVLGMVVTLFPERGEQARAIGVYSFFQAAGGTIGLLLGGVLTQAIGWHWIFAVNVPIGVATALAGARLLHRDAGLGVRRGADAAGALLIVGALMLGVYAIVGIDAHGAGSSAGLGAVAAALLVAFVARESTTPNPLMPLRLLRTRTVSGANLLLALLVAAMFTMQFLAPLYLRRVLGYDAVEIGLAFVPVPLAIAVLSVGITGRLVVRFGAPVTLLPGLALIALGLVLLARAPVAAQYLRDVLPAMLALGLGGGLALPALMTLAMTGVAGEDAGIASGLANTTMQVGGALGLALLATLSAARTAQLQDAGVRGADALLAGYHLGFAIGAALMSVAIAVTAIAVIRARRRGAQLAGTPSAARRSAAMSSLRIPSIASIARRARSGSGSEKTSSIPTGTTCQDRP
jgi:EmrB/QacA subfamily drug resistance transporter